MAKKAKKIKTKEGLKLEIVNPNAAGIDVSSREMQVCVPEARDADNNRRFATFTEDLHSISSWLKSCNIDTVAMESTGIYWVQLYMILEADGFDVLMVNAKAIKNIGEKKTDEVDAEWIMLLHTYGLLRASFQPDNYARRIRNLSRHRDNLIRASSREIQHIQKAMELMNIKLTNVLSDIMGKSGQSIIFAILDGERDASKLASLADPRCKSPKEIIERSLVANWDDDLLFMLQQSFELYHYLHKQMKDCEEKIEVILKEYIETLPQSQENLPKECPKIDNVKAKKNEISIDIEYYAFKIWGVNLMHIPGVRDTTLLKLMGELGADFTKKFVSYKEFCSWANLTPNNKITGGKLLSSKVPKRKNNVGLTLRSSANSLKQNKAPLGFYFRRIQARKGYIPAIIATANKLGRIIFTLVENKIEYDEAFIKIDEEEILRKKILRVQKDLDKLQKQLKKCG